MQKRARHDARVLVLAVLIGLGVLAIDTGIPLGVAAGVPHIVPVLVAMWLSRPKLILLVALISTAFVLAGWELSSVGGEYWTVAANRGLAVFAIWVIAMLGYQRNQAQRRLSEAYGRLEGLVQQRTTELEDVNVSLQRELAERKQIEVAMRRSESELRIITDNVPAFISYVGADHRYRFVNEKYVQAFGAPKDRIIGMHVSELLGDGAYQTIRPHFEKAFAGERAAFETQLPATLGNGTRWVSTSLIPDAGPGGRVEGLFALVIDITKTKQTEENHNKLLTLEKRHRAEAEQTKQQIFSIFERVTDAFVALDTDWRYTYVNEKAAQAFGRTPEDLMGKHIWTVFPEGVGQPFHRAYEKAMREQVFVQLEEWYEPWDRWFENRIYPAQDGISIFFQDVTKRVKSEQQLRLVKSAVEHAFDAVAITAVDADSQDPRIEYVNTAFSQMTGYPPDEAIGKTLKLLSGPKTDPTVFDRILSSRQQGRSFSSEMTGYRKDGSDFLVEWRKDPVRDASGRITHWVSILRDITQRVELEDRNRRHLEEAARISRVVSMGELASGLAHEINQPLTVVKTYNQTSLNMIQNGVWDKDRLATAMQESSQACDRACMIIHRLKSLVRKREPKRIETQLNDVVHNALSLILHHARHKSVDIRAELSAGLPLVMADKIQIEQVLHNFLSNGIEAMNGQAGADDDHHPPHEIVIRTRLVDEVGEIEVSVRDNGRGIETGQLEDLFRPLYTTKIDGVGVGLSISRSIIEAHRGRLWATANDTCGMTFSFTLPIENVC